MKAKSQQIDLGLISDEGGFCRLETKHNRRIVPRPELFISARKLQEQRPQPYKSALGLSSGEDGSCSLKLSKIG
jgi:hypothetical protein